MLNAIPDPRFATSVPRPRLPSYMRNRVPGSFNGYGQSGGDAAPAPTPQPSRAQVDSANTAQSNADYAAAAPPMRPGLRNTTPGAMSITLPKGMEPAERNFGHVVADENGNASIEGRDEITKNPNGQTTVMRSGTMPLQTPEDEATAGNARRQAYVGRQKRLSNYLYPGMQDQQLKEDANTRANETSAAGVADVGDERKQHAAAIKDLQTQLAARDKSMSEERASHATALNELKARMDAIEKGHRMDQGDARDARQQSGADARTAETQRKTEQGNRRLDQGDKRIEQGNQKMQQSPFYKPPTTQPTAKIPPGGDDRSRSLPTPEQIEAIKQEAGGDPDKAAQIAAQRGFRVVR